MDIAGDISRLRQEGVSDDEILNGYKTYSPDDAQDIDRLLQEGRTASELVDGLTTFKRAAAPPKQEDGLLTTARKALQYGTAQGVTAVGSTLKHLGAGKTVEGWGQTAAPDQYDPALPKVINKGGEGIGWSHIPRAALELAPGMLASLAALKLSVPAALGLGAAQAFGPTLDARQANNGGAPLTAGDYAAGVGSAAAGGVLNTLGAGGVAGSSIRGAGLQGLASIPKAIVNAGVREGVTEAAQDVVQQALETGGTAKGLEVDPKQALASGIMGGVVGGGVRAAGATGDIANVARYSFTDQDSNIRVADRLSRSGVKLNSPQEELTALKTVEDMINADIGESTKLAKGVLEQTGGQPAVDEALAVITNGGKLSKDQLKGLEEALVRHPDGVPLYENIKDLSTLRGLRKRGTVSKDMLGFGDERYFEGGIAGKYGGLLDPRRSAGKILGAAGMGLHTAGSMAIPLGSQLATMGPLLASAFGVQTGLYAGAKGIDKLMGNSAPVANFKNQFSGLERGPSPDIVDPVQSTEDLKALAGRATQKNRLDGLLEGAVQKGVNEAAKDIKRGRALDNEIAKIEDDHREKHTRETDKLERRKAQNVDDAWRAYKGAEERFRGPQAMTDKAWAPAEPKLPKAASEEKLWAYQEKKAAAEARLEAAKADNKKKAIAEAEQALSDIENEYRTLELDIKALELKAEADAQAEATKEASRKGIETDRAWKAHEASQKAPKASPALSDSLWASQERPKPADPKARQVDDLFASAEGKPVDRDRAEQLMQREIDAYENSKPKPKKEKAKKEPKKTREEIREEAEAVFKKPEGESKVEREARVSEDAGRVREVFRHRGIDHEVPDGVHNASGYKRGIRRNQDAIHDGLEAILGDRHSPDTGELLYSKAYEDIALARTAADAKDRLHQMLEAEGLSRLEISELTQAFEAKLYKVYSQKE